jgi:glycosyltransferase involved in cell wall biosynthesis
MKAKTLVTVIVATHNRVHCLSRALDSIYAQEGLGSLYDLEVILVDDGSTDSTPEIIHRYQHLTYIRLPERRGISAAMNEGLRASRGSYITFLDDDDEWLPHKLRVQVPLMDAHPEVGVVYGQSLKRFEEKEWLTPDLTRAHSGEVFLAMLMDNFCGHHASILVRRGAFDSAGGFDETLLSYEDWDVSLRLAFHVKFLFNPGAVDIYNLSPNGLWLSRAASGTGADDARRVIEKNLQLLPDSAEYQEFKRKARSRLELDTSMRITDPILAWAKVTAALRESPDILGDDGPKTMTGDVLARLIFQPKLDIWKLTSLLSEATPDDKASGRKSFQSTIVRVMAGIAARSTTDNRSALRVTACAFAYAPFCLTAYKLILRTAVRTLLGRGVESVCCGAYKKAKRIRPAAREASALTQLGFQNPNMHIPSIVSLNSQENGDLGQQASRLRARAITHGLTAPDAARRAANQHRA